MALVTTVLIVTIALLGELAGALAGTGLWSHLLPFAGAVLALGIAAALLLRAWLALRGRLAGYAARAPAVLAVVVAGVALAVSRRPAFRREMGDLQALVGGSAAAERASIAHQVWATYRRTDTAQMLRILERARVYEATVHEAAAAFAVDPEVLMGVGAAESAFYPRDSADGGRGLFQITAPPAEAVAETRRRLHVEQLDALNQRHNAFLAAATLHLYLDEMSGDLFLARRDASRATRKGTTRRASSRPASRGSRRRSRKPSRMRGGFSERGRAAAMADRDVDAAIGEPGELIAKLLQPRHAHPRDHGHLEARAAAAAQCVLHDGLGDVRSEPSGSPHLTARAAWCRYEPRPHEGRP